MSGSHPELGPELRQLAQLILNTVDPALRAAATLVSARAGDEGSGPCQQVWCPVCALAALITGEEHPLLTVVAQHSEALLVVIRSMVDSAGSGDTPGGADTAAKGAAPSPNGAGNGPGRPDPAATMPPPPTEPSGPTGPGGRTGLSGATGPGGDQGRGRYEAIPVSIEE